MRITLNATDRKALATTLEGYVGMQGKYLGVPSYAYQIGSLIVTKDGNIEAPDNLGGSDKTELVACLKEAGYDFDETEILGAPEEEAEQDEEEQTDMQNEEKEAGEQGAAEEEHPLPPIDQLEISIPRNLLTEEQLQNLRNLVSSKETLIEKALGVNGLPITLDEEKITFPWFVSEHLTAEEATAYSTFIGKLCDTAKNQSRVSPKEKETDNEKFTFRIFLIKLGMKGEEYKKSRKILMRSLKGNAAFRHGKPEAKEVEA